MPNLLQAVVFCTLLAITIAVTSYVGQHVEKMAAILTFVVGFVISVLIAVSIKVANQWERGVVLRLGQFRGIRGPGLFFIVPVIDRVRMIDTRVLAHHIREQEVITRDNVPVTIDSVLFYRVVNAEDAVMKIQDYAFALPLAQCPAQRGWRYDVGRTPRRTRTNRPPDRAARGVGFSAMGSPCDGHPPPGH